MSLFDAYHYRRVAEAYNAKSDSMKLYEELGEIISLAAKQGKFEITYSYEIALDEPTAVDELLIKSEVIYDVADLLIYKGYRVSFPYKKSTRTTLFLLMKVEW